MKHPKAKEEDRRVFQEKIRNYQARCKPIAYIDESGFAYDMPRTHGYAVKGQRCYGTHAWGAKGRTNAIGALIKGELLTVSLFDCNVNTEIFNGWVEQDLIPKLPKGTVVVMDNVTFHKSIKMKEQIIKAGHIIEYLPPYSPDLNPIEHKWAQAKSIKRKYNYDEHIYIERHLIECFFGKLKHFRRVFSRFDKAKTTFQAFIDFAATLISLR